MKSISSADNAHYKAILKLAHSSRERRKAGMSVLDGDHLITAYLDHVGKPEQVAVSTTAVGIRRIQELLDALMPLKPLLLSDALFRQLSTVESPTGVMAVVSTPRPLIVPADLGTCFMIEDIQDPGNLGSILRSAAASGIKSVLLSMASVHAWSPRVLRAGMGAHFVLKIYEQAELPQIARTFGGTVIATAKQAKRQIFDVDLTGDVAIVLGNEGSGVSDALRALADEQVAIPMVPGIESLNVAAAAAVCAFERVRQLRLMTKSA
jgi:RNA methyltransferase, TrmH family